MNYKNEGINVIEIYFMKKIFYLHFWYHNFFIVKSFNYETQRIH